jgi:hypothetical protein
MLATLQVIALMLVAVGMATTLGHALEMPGKLRLSEPEYRIVQPIYYPGFTYAGLIGEFGGILATALVAMATPKDTAAFWLVLTALSVLLLMHALYWVLTHPVNRIWLKDEKLKGAGATFFGIGSRSAPADWKEARDRWEYSHVARAVCSITALALIAIATSLD